MKKLLFASSNSYAPTVLRTLMAIVLLAHGAQKLLGWFGGFGFSNTMQFFTSTVGLPWIIGFLVIIIEFFGSISLFIGLAVRPWAIAMSLLIIGIVLTSHIQNGFFMNWFGKQPGEGYEFFILMIAITISLVITGAGKWSVDERIAATITK